MTRNLRKYLRRLWPLIAVFSLVVIPLGAIADAPFLTTTATFSVAGNQAVLTALSGQSSCSFYLSGSPGAVDIQGTNDTSATPAWTTLPALTYASPPVVEASPFTPISGESYQFSPTSFKKVRVVADSTWTGSATVFLGCSSSVARVSGGGGGIQSVTGTNPIAASTTSGATTVSCSLCATLNTTQSISGAKTFTNTATFNSSFPPAIRLTNSPSIEWGTGSLAFSNTGTVSGTGGIVYNSGASNDVFFQGTDTTGNQFNVQSGALSGVVSFAQATTGNNTEFQATAGSDTAAFGVNPVGCSSHIFFIGVDTICPEQFDATGNTFFNYPVQMGSSGTATSTTNYPSQPLGFANSTWSSGAPVTNVWTIQNSNANVLTTSYNGTAEYTQTPTVMNGSGFESTAAGGGFFAYGSLLETNAIGQTDNNPRSCTNVGADGGIYIGTNLDGPTAWTIANLNGSYTFAACYNNSSYGAPPIPQGIVWNVVDRTGLGNYFSFNDTDFPVRFSSAVNVGGYASFNPTTGQLSPDPGQSGVISVTSPASCASLAACGTGTETFTTAMPNTTYSCTLTAENYPFVGYITSKTTTAVTFTLVTLSAISIATTVPVDFHCREQ